jgi:hypothetical protein
MPARIRIAAPGAALCGRVFDLDQGTNGQREFNYSFFDAGLDENGGSRPTSRITSA